MSNTVLKVNNLIKTYPIRTSIFKKPAALQALRGVSFYAKKGETLAIVGESGCGKSTLARQITLLEKPTSGTIELNGNIINNYSRTALKDIKKTVQMIFQDPYGSLNPRKTVMKTLEAPLIINTKLNATERANRINDIAKKVGLGVESLDKYPHMFSGGQRQRIAIARSLMLNPQLIIADEPVSSLDVSVQAQVLNIMMDLQDEFKIAYIFISHNLSVVRHIANDVIVMYLGNIVEIASKNDLFNRPKHPYTKMLMNSAMRFDGTGGGKKEIIKGELPSPLNPPSGCAFSSRCPFATDKCRKDNPTLEAIEGKRKVACFHHDKL